MRNQQVWIIMKDSQVYTKEVIDLKLKAIQETCNDILKVATEGRDQARLTNGRATALEKINENRNGASRVIMYIGSTLAALLLAYLSWLGVHISAIEHTLAAYEITVDHQ